MGREKPAKIEYRTIYRLSQFLVRLLMRLVFGARFVHLEKFPSGGPVILASNHVSNFDPPAIGCAVPREIFFLGKRELFRNFFFGWLIRFYNTVPIRRGVMDWTAIAALKDILAREGVVIMFPEGTRGTEGQLGEPKFGVGMLAQETGAVIVPAFLRGTSRLKEAFLRRRPMRVLYGRPISPDEYAQFERNPKGQVALARLVMERIAELQAMCAESETRQK